MIDNDRIRATWGEAESRIRREIAEHFREWRRRNPGAWESYVAGRLR